jgi:hypothetical protein
LITETLRGSQAGCLCHDISDSALKVVFTTLYVDIKEPAACARFSPQKKLNLSPAMISQPGRLGGLPFIMPGQN